MNRRLLKTSRKAAVWALLLAIGLFVTPITVAQPRGKTISGTVVDDAKKPLVGATVVVEGKKRQRHYRHPRPLSNHSLARRHAGV